MTHYHITRLDYNNRTGQPMDSVGLGIRSTYAEGRAVSVQDEKQFRLPGAERWITHEWTVQSCSEDSHISGPYG
jgi:hypothetical protein